MKTDKFAFRPENLQKWDFFSLIRNFPTILNIKWHESWQSPSYGCHIGFKWATVEQKTGQLAVQNDHKMPCSRAKHEKMQNIQPFLKKIFFVPHQSAVQRSSHRRWLIQSCIFLCFYFSQENQEIWSGGILCSDFLKNANFAICRRTEILVSKMLHLW